MITDPVPHVPTADGADPSDDATVLDDLGPANHPAAG